MYRLAANKYMAVLLCALVVVSSLSAVYAVEYNPKSGICYILPVYHNICRISEYNKQTLENEQQNSDNIWIKEDVNLCLQDRMPDRLMPHHGSPAGIAEYTSALQLIIQSCSCIKGKIYHMLN